MIPRRPNLLAVAGLLALLSMGSAEDSSREPRQQMPLGAVWVVGDSIGVGVAAGLRRAGVSVVEKARNSTTARQWVSRLRDPSYWPTAPSVVVVSLGTNDAVSAELRKEFRANAQALMQALAGRGHSVIWILPPSPSARIPEGSDLEFLIGLGGRWILDRGLPLADAWHPTVTGYDRLAAAVETIRKGR